MKKFRVGANGILVVARILAKITTDGVFVEELEHNPASRGTQVEY